MTEDRSAVTIIIKGRVTRYRFTKWECGSALTPVDDEKAKQVRKQTGVIGYNVRGEVVRRSERLWTD
jgi:hypothetical protein